MKASFCLVVIFFILEEWRSSASEIVDCGIYEFVCDGFCVPLYEFCDGRLDCSNKMDEKTTGQGLMCLSESAYKCIPPEQFLCDGIAHCQDDADEAHCFDGDGNNYYCNGEEDFQGGLDECFCSDKEKNVYSSETCFRCFDGSYRFHNSDFCDGVIHCNDLTDECLCGEEDLPICKLINWGTKEFSCAANSRSLLGMSKICDRIEDCDNAIDEKYCDGYEKKIRNYRCDPRGSEQRATKCDSVPTCKNLDDECKGCENKPEFCNYISGDEFRCNNGSPVYGVNVCDGSPQCPEEEDELHCPNTTRFYCDKPSKSTLHVSQDKVCDLKSDCADSSDELNCAVQCENCQHCNTTHFYCPGEENEFIDCRKKVCNGPEDCISGDDECQGCTVGIFSNDESMISATGTLPFLWIISIIAVTGNFFVILSSSLNLFYFKIHNSMERSQTSLILNLASADFLVGIYTLVVSIQNVVLSRDRYCRQDHAWRSSAGCNFLGVILTIGCEASVFILSAITTYRLNAVVRQFFRPPRKRVYVAALVAWILAIILAVIPLAPSAQNYFVESKWFGDNPFLSRVTREELADYTARLSAMQGVDNSYIQQNGGHGSWELLETLLVRVNPEYVAKRKFGYYSAHGVCLPKFFPIPSKDAAWGFSFFIIALNFAMFLYICVAYMIIFKKATGGDLGSQNQENRYRTLQRKLTRMVLSDFCCWVPICVIAFLRVVGVHISDDVYVPVGTILIPINSMLNPFLYSEVPEYVWEKLSPVRTRVSSIWTSVREQTQGSAIEMTDQASSGVTRPTGETMESALSQSKTN